MICPNCRKFNQPTLSDAQQDYFKCPRCLETYARPVRVEAPKKPARGRGRPAGVSARASRPRKATPFRKMAADKRAAIREMIYRIKANYYGGTDVHHY